MQKFSECESRRRNVCRCSSEQSLHKAVRSCPWFLKCATQKCRIIGKAGSTESHLVSHSCNIADYGLVRSEWVYVIQFERETMPWSRVRMQWYHSGNMVTLTEDGFVQQFRTIWTSGQTANKLSVLPANQKPDCQLSDRDFVVANLRLALV